MPLMKRCQLILLAVIWPSRKRLVYACSWAGALIALLHIPLLNIPAVLAAWPMISAVPEFGRTGADVEWYHFGPILQSPKAFIVFFLYYTLIAYPLLIHVGHEAIRKHRAPRAQTTTPGDVATLHCRPRTTPAERQET